MPEGADTSVISAPYRIDIQMPQAHFPAFVIGGAAKSGTTSLSRYLAQQPGIFIPDRELNFFTYAGHQPNYRIQNHSFVSDIESYLQVIEPPESLNNNTIIGEKSVSYLYKRYYSQVIKNIKLYHPSWQSLKWIFILRQPVERAYSQYIHNRNFHEDLPFREAISHWPARKSSRWIPAYDYLGAGYYSESIQAFLRHFEHVKVYLFEDLTNRPEWLLEDIFRFLDFNESEFVRTTSFQKFNPSGIPKNKMAEIGYRLLNNAPVKWLAGKMLSSKTKQNLKQFTHQKPPLSAIDKKELSDYYKTDLKKLESLISRDLSDWYEAK